jgi:hypothetical protein
LDILISISSWGNIGVHLNHVRWCEAFTAAATALCSSHFCLCVLLF